MSDGLNLLQSSAVEPADSVGALLEAQVLPCAEFPAEVCTFFTFRDGTQLLFNLSPEAALVYGQSLLAEALRLMPPQGHA